MVLGLEHPSTLTRLLSRPFTSFSTTISASVYSLPESLPTHFGSNASHNHSMCMGNTPRCCRKWKVNIWDNGYVSAPNRGHDDLSSACRIVIDLRYNSSRPTRCRQSPLVCRRVYLCYQWWQTQGPLIPLTPDQAHPSPIGEMATMIDTPVLQIHLWDRALTACSRDCEGQFAQDFMRYLG